MRLAALYSGAVPTPKAAGGFPKGASPQSDFHSIFPESGHFRIDPPAARNDATKYHHRHNSAHCGSAKVQRI